MTLHDWKYRGLHSATDAGLHVWECQNCQLELRVGRSGPKPPDNLVYGDLTCGDRMAEQVMDS